jgi:hypothetical protein
MDSGFLVFRGNSLLTRWTRIVVRVELNLFLKLGLVVFDFGFEGYELLVLALEV